MLDRRKGHMQAPLPVVLSFIRKCITLMKVLKENGYIYLLASLIYAVKNAIGLKMNLTMLGKDSL